VASGKPDLTAERINVYRLKTERLSGFRQRLDGIHVSFIEHQRFAVLEQPQLLGGGHRKGILTGHIALGRMALPFFGSPQ
jgi:hypothetical protein